jgi:hypothetical protein
VVVKVVVVFDRLEGGFLAVEAEVVDWDGFGEEEVRALSTKRPEQRVGVRQSEVEGGWMVWVV